MNKRIKNLRKTLKLTQQEFGNRIGIKRNTLANYEIGRNEPIDAVISLICREFNVSEKWLRTGEGEMFVQQSKEDELSAAVERLLSGESSEFKRRFVVVLSKLDVNEWEILEKRLNEIVVAKTEPAVPVMAPASIDTEQSQWEQEADEFAAKAAALAREQFLAEKKQVRQASSAKESDAV